MSRRLRLATGVASVGLLVAAAVLVLTESGPRPAEAAVIGYGSSATDIRAMAQLSATAGGGHRFLISGAVGSMYPGLAKPLVLVVFNPNNVGIKVQSITTTVANASSACPASDLLVNSFAGNQFVGAGGQATVTVTATMSHAAPDSCQGALFPLSYSGSAQPS
jgi:hypothetical protein